jgi:hypothetical protein
VEIKHTNAPAAPVHVEKLENTRVGLSGFEAFKQQREDSRKKDNNEAAKIAKGEDVKTNSPNPKEENKGSEENTENPDTQGELGLNEPPENAVLSETNSEWANSVGESELISWWNQFVETQSVKTASLMKMMRPVREGNEVVVTIAASKMEVLEAVRFPFNRFITDISGGRLTGMRIVAGEVKEQERKPYTDKEKLDYLTKKNPELEEIIRKLGLRLP